MDGSSYMPESIDSLTPMSRKSIEQVIGNRYGILTVDGFLGRNCHRKFVVSCKCDCGKETAAILSGLKNGGKVSCGCLRVARASKLNFSHGMSKSREYGIWCGIKSRVFDKNDKAYCKYSVLGMEEDLASNFSAFMDEVGYPPNDGKDYTIDRIDNSKGYFKGNIRWACRSTQRKNQGIRSDNKTGVTGVGKILCYDKVNYVYTSFWCDMGGKTRSKRFNTQQFGDELAFFAACEYRELMVLKLNLAGAGYSEKHGTLENTVNTGGGGL